MQKYHLLTDLKGTRHTFTATITQLLDYVTITVKHLQLNAVPVYTADMIPLELRPAETTAHIDAPLFHIKVDYRASYGVAIFYETQRLTFKATVCPPYKTKPLPPYLVYDGLWLAKFYPVFPERKDNVTVEVKSADKITTLRMFYSEDLFFYNVTDRATGKLLKGLKGPITDEVLARYSDLLDGVD